MTKSAHDISRLLPKSRVFTGLEWISDCYSYPEPDVRGDTYPVTWSDDDELYASSGDPLWGDVDYIYGEVKDGSRESHNVPDTTGLDVEKFTGEPPNHRIHKINDMVNYNGFGAWGPKPTGMISVKGVLYLAIQNLMGYRPPLYGTASQHGSDALIVKSEDKGRTWSKGWLSEWELRRLGPMFPGPHFGGPSFVQYGKDNEWAKDDYIYALSADQWDNGSHLRVGRVKSDRILEASAWEWVARLENSQPVWTSVLDMATPVLTMERSLGVPEMVYLPAEDRYLLLTWKLKQDFTNDCGSELFVLEAPQPWGPFSLVHHEAQWETNELNPYCPRIPMKWYNAPTNEGWLIFSGSWVERGPYYRMHSRKFRLLK